jgi:Fe-S cluster assembly scaffold protein SufB
MIKKLNQFSSIKCLDDSYYYKKEVFFKDEKISLVDVFPCNTKNFVYFKDQELIDNNSLLEFYLEKNSKLFFIYEQKNKNIKNTKINFFLEEGASLYFFNSVINFNEFDQNINVFLKQKKTQVESYNFYLGDKKTSANLDFNLNVDGEKQILKNYVYPFLNNNSYLCLKSTPKISSRSKNFVNISQINSFLFGENVKLKTFPQLLSSNSQGVMEHSFYNKNLKPEQNFYLETRGFNKSDIKMFVLNSVLNKICQKIPEETIKNCFKQNLLKNLKL